MVVMTIATATDGFAADSLRQATRAAFSAKHEKYHPNKVGDFNENSACF
jgi:hypothetical protein